MQISEVFEKVKEVLTKVREENGSRAIDISMESSLVSDLGFTSLMFVDLTLALENAFRFSQFPIQAWIDEQIALQESGFRVRSLAERCYTLLND